MHREVKNSSTLAGEELRHRATDNIFLYSNFEFFDDASESSVTSLHVVFIFCSKFMLMFLQFSTGTRADEIIIK